MEVAVWEDWRERYSDDEGEGDCGGVYLSRTVGLKVVEGILILANNRRRS